jgi:tripartite-type tricarboxylate transporter receptor subunit TctC
MNFRRLSVCAALLLVVAGLPVNAQPAADYPSRPIRLLVGYAAGGPTDAIARVIAQDMSATLGQSVFVENKGAASSMVATREIKAARADGYNLLFASLGHNVNAVLHGDKVGYNAERDFSPIGAVATLPLVIVNRFDAPEKTMKALTDKVNSSQEPVTFASSGNGGSGHLAGELLASTLKKKMLHIPYKGSSAALVDVMAGRIDFMFYPVVGVAENVQARKINVLASASTQRLPQFPNVPTMAEAGLQGFESTASWVGMLAPANTPPDVVKKLNDALRVALAKPEVRARIESFGAFVLGNSPSEFGVFLKRDYNRWAEVIKAAGVTAE